MRHLVTIEMNCMEAFCDIIKNGLGKRNGMGRNRDCLIQTDAKNQWDTMGKHQNNIRDLNPKKRGTFINPLLPARSAAKKHNGIGQ